MPVNYDFNKWAEKGFPTDGTGWITFRDRRELGRLKGWRAVYLGTRLVTMHSKCGLVLYGIINPHDRKKSPKGRRKNKKSRSAKKSASYNFSDFVETRLRVEASMSPVSDKPRTPPNHSSRNKSINDACITKDHRISGE